MTDELYRPAAGLLVTVDQLLDMRQHDSVIVFDARIARTVGEDGKTSYQKGYQSFVEDGHIPQAIFADLFEVFSDPDAAYPFMRPSADILRPTLGAIGIDSHSRIVAYDSLSGAWAARLCWLLKAAGLNHVSVLNGGLAAWQAAGQPLAYGPADTRPPLTPPSLETASGFFVDLPEVISLTERPGQSKLICALRQNEYEAGHIPGSLSLPYASVLNTNGAIDVARTRAAAAAAGISRNDNIVIYCGGGINAAGLGIALASIGFDRIAVYDGSLSEWKDEPSRPLILGGEP